jgi:NAD(P)-dependent dehydrogenase (short-subunit alcohol dehydrogenase family)
MASEAGRLRNKSAIVTGAGRGIGREIAFALAREGAAVTVLARNQSEIVETAAAITAAGGAALAIPADVADGVAMIGAVDRAVATFGSVDILVNNAAIIGPIGSFIDNDAAEWSATISVNLLGTVHGCKAVLPQMIASGRGKIINLSGGGATAGRPRFSAYAASKAAIVRLTETLAEELRPHNIQVNAIAPGAVNTRMLDRVLAAGAAAGADVLAEAEQQRRRGGASPTEAADLAVFLASSHSDRLTGRLVAALHDGWREWGDAEISRTMSAPWLTLRRLDHHTVTALLEPGKPAQ